MKDSTPDKKTPKRRRSRRRVSSWTTRQKLMRAARVGDTAVTTVGDVVRLAVKILISVLLVALTSGLLFMCIFAYYVKNSLTTDLNITLSDYSLSLSSTIWAYDDNGSPVELAVLRTDENRTWLNYDEIPEYFEKAAVAIEDKRFYDHHSAAYQKHHHRGRRHRTAQAG